MRSRDRTKLIWQSLGSRSLASQRWIYSFRDFFLPSKYLYRSDESVGFHAWNISCCQIVQGRAFLSLVKKFQMSILQNSKIRLYLSAGNNFPHILATDQRINICCSSKTAQLAHDITNWCWQDLGKNALRVQILKNSFEGENPDYSLSQWLINQWRLKMQTLQLQNFHLDVKGQQWNFSSKDTNSQKAHKWSFIRF